MKKHLLFLLAALIALASCSDNDGPEPPKPPVPDPTVPEAKIPEWQARAASQQAWNEFYPTTRYPLIKSCVAYDENLQAVTSSYKEPMVYIFNFENNAGYTVMAANPALPELLAISDNGNISASSSYNSDTDLFMARLKDYMHNNLDTVQEKPDTVVPGQVYTEATGWTTTATIPALCKVEWGEDYPFNQFCPPVGFGHRKAGFDAVAIAQAYSVFGQPTSLKGYTFDWPAMIAATSLKDTVAVSQIARLMQLIGEIGQFNYETTVENIPFFTSATLPGVLNVFKACGYDKVEGTLADGTTPLSYSATTVQSELEASHPVIVRGRVASSNYFYAWLVHGLNVRERNVEQRRAKEDGSYDVLSTTTEKLDYVLCNWGYYGVLNGFFLSSVFGPTTAGTPSAEINMITNIYPTR